MGFVQPGRNNHSKITGRKYRDGKRPPSNPYLPRASKRSSKTPPTAPLSRLESLPTELLHKIFTECHNPSLPASSRRLARALNFQSLHLSYVRSTQPTTATETLKLRFFTHEFLVTYEQRFSELDLSAAYLPVHRLLSPPWDPARVQFFTELTARGAKLDPAEREEHLSTLHDAVVDSRPDAVGALLRAGLRADAESLRLAVGMEDVAVMRMLCEAGAPVHDVGVWKSAMEANRVGLKFVLEMGSPPGEVLGEVGRLLAGGGSGLLRSR